MPQRSCLIITILSFVFAIANAQTVVSSEVVHSYNGIDYQKTIERAEIVTHPTPAVTFLDFSNDAFSQIRLHLDDAHDGDTLFICSGECTKEGRIDRNPGGSRRCREMFVVTKAGQRDYDVVIPRDERNTRHPAILMPEDIGEVTPFRYLEIDSRGRYDISAASVSRIVVNAPFNNSAASFHCDNENLNRVWELCKHTVKATTYTGYYVDGDRERIAYEADALINQLSHYGVDTNYDVARRTFERLMELPTWPTEWIMQMDMIAWNDYMFTGDTSMAEGNYAGLYAHTLIELVDKQSGLVSSCKGQTKEFLHSIARQDTIRDIVDWPHSGMLGLAAGQGGEDDGYVYTDFNTVVNAYHYKAVLCYAELIKALGDKKMSRKLQSYCKRFKGIFNKAFLDKQRGIYRDGIGTDHASLHANMFAMAFGLVPEEYKQSVADFICSRCLDPTGAPTMVCSVYGAQFLLEALYECGRDDVALQLMTSEGKRSWMNMLREGSTLTMEAWGNEFKPNQDWNHAWGSAPANILPFHLVGVHPLKPGFEEVEIRPQIGSLKEVEALVPTIKGSIGVKISKRDDGTLSVAVTIPEGILAHVVLPKNIRKGSVVTINGNVL